MIDMRDASHVAVRDATRSLRPSRRSSRSADLIADWGTQKSFAVGHHHEGAAGLAHHAFVGLDATGEDLTSTRVRILLCSIDYVRTRSLILPCTWRRLEAQECNLSIQPTWETGV